MTSVAPHDGCGLPVVARSVFGRVHDLDQARLQGRREPLQVVGPGVTAAVDEACLDPLALGPRTHRAVAARPVAAPHRPDQRGVGGPDTIEQLRGAPAAAGAQQVAARVGREGIRPDPGGAPHLVGEFHETGRFELFDLMVGEVHAHVVPGELRDARRERRELAQHERLIGVDDQLPAGAPGRPVARHETIEVLARSHDHDGLAGLACRQCHQLVFDLLLATQAVAVAAGAQRGALEQEPVGAAQSRVGEQLLEAKAGAPVGA